MAEREVNFGSVHIYRLPTRLSFNAIPYSICGSLPLPALRLYARWLNYTYVRSVSFLVSPFPLSASLHSPPWLSIPRFPFSLPSRYMCVQILLSLLPAWYNMRPFPRFTKYINSRGVVYAEVWWSWRSVVCMMRGGAGRERTIGKYWYERVGGGDRADWYPSRVWNDIFGGGMC